MRSEPQTAEPIDIEPSSTWEGSWDVVGRDTGYYYEIHLSWVDAMASRSQIHLERRSNENTI